MFENISVLGPGSWGTALTFVLAKNHKVNLWSKFPEHIQKMEKDRSNNDFLPGFPFNENISVFSDLSEIQKSDLVLVAVPSHAFSETLKSIKPYLGNIPMIWATKGLEPKTGAFLHTLVEKELPNTKYAMLSGPSFAKEVAEEIPTAVNIAAKDLSYAKDLCKTFSTNYFSAYPATDIIGMQLGAVVKNVLAVAAGISDGLKFGANTRAALITLGIKEAMALATKLNADPSTLCDLPGIGDIILTCTDNQSRNRRFGLAIAANKTQQEAFDEIGQVVEAAHNVEEICLLANQYDSPMPIANQVKLILQGKESPKSLTKGISNA